VVGRPGELVVIKERLKSSNVHAASPTTLCVFAFLFDSLSTVKALPCDDGERGR